MTIRLALPRSLLSQVSALSTPTPITPDGRVSTAGHWGTSIWLDTLGQTIRSPHGAHPVGTLGAVSSGEHSAKPYGADTTSRQQNPSQL